MTPGCVKTASDILSNLDDGVNPCKDFYQFACGGFMKRTSIPDDRTRMSSFSVLGDELLTQGCNPFGFSLHAMAMSAFRLFADFLWRVLIIVANDSRPGRLIYSKIMVELKILVVILCHEHAVVVDLRQT